MISNRLLPESTEIIYVKDGTDVGSLVLASHQFSMQSMMIVDFHDDVIITPAFHSPTSLPSCLVGGAPWSFDTTVNNVSASSSNHSDCRRHDKPGRNESWSTSLRPMRGIYSGFPPNANSHYVATNFVEASFGNALKVWSLPLHRLAHAGFFTTPLFLTQSCFLYPCNKTTPTCYSIVVWLKFCPVLFFFETTLRPYDVDAVACTGNFGKRKTADEFSWLKRAI